MAERGTERRLKASYGVQAGLSSLIWLLNLYQIASRFRSMAFVPAVVAGMIFFLLPIDIWRGISSFREYRG